MKNLFVISTALLCSVLVGCKKEKTVEDMLIGQWCNPSAYEEMGELKGFHFQKNGECDAINVPALDLKSWEIDKEGYLVVKGTYTDENGKSVAYETREQINLLTEDSLKLTEIDSPEFTFLYLKYDVLKERVSPQVPVKE